MKKQVISLFLILFIFNLFAQTNTKKNSESDRPKVALVLAGGGARGFAHIPIVDAIQKAGIPIDIIIGTSAGALIGGFYASGYDANTINSNLKEIDWTSLFLDSPPNKFDNYMQNRIGDPFPIEISLGKNLSVSMGKGVFTGQYVFETIKKMLVKIPSNINFDDLEIPFRAVAVDLLTGEQVVLDSGDLPEAMRSSMSLPGIFEPFVIDGRYLIDGTLLNNIPVSVAKDMGYDIIIVSDISVLPETDISFYDQLPLNTLSQCLGISQFEKIKNEEQYVDLIIRPDLSNYSTIDYHYMDEILKQGEKAAIAYAPQIEEIRKQFPNDMTVNKIESILDKPELQVSSLEMQGIKESDKKLIKQTFELIKDKPFTDETMQFFMRKIYDTGNYTLVNPSIEKSDIGYKLVLKTTPAQTEKHIAQISPSYGSTLSDRLYSSLDMTTNLTFRGLSGRGSALSFSIFSIDAVGAQFNYLQPIGHIFFIEASAAYHDGTSFLSQTENSPIILTQRNQQAWGDFLLGFCINQVNCFTIEAKCQWLNSFQEKDENSSIFTDTVLSFNTKYKLDTIEKKVFPKSGIKIQIDTSTIKPLSETTKNILGHKLSGDIEYVIPITKKIIFSDKIFYGTELTDSLSTITPINMMQSFTLADRKYFPAIINQSNYASNKFFTACSFRFEPFKAITALGGKIGFLLDASIGTIWNGKNFDEIKTFEWNTNTGIYLSITRALGIKARIGVGSNENEIKPYLAFDLGNFQ